MSEPSLEELMSDDVPVSEEQEEKQEDVKTEEEETKEESQEESKEEPEAKPEEDSEKPVTSREVAAIIDERNKAQALKKENEELRAQLETREEVVDPVSDPEGFREQQNKDFARQRFEDAFDLMSETNPQLSEAWEWANQETQDNPFLLSKLSEHQGKPVALLRSVVKSFEQHQKMASLEDVDAVEARIRAKVEAEVRAELGQKSDAEAAKAEETAKAISKPSLTTTGTSQSAAFEGELSLEDLMGTDFAHRPK